MIGREEIQASSTDAVIVAGEFDVTVEIGYNNFDKSTAGEYPVFIEIADESGGLYTINFAGVSLGGARLLRDKLNQILGES